MSLWRAGASGHTFATMPDAAESRQLPTDQPLPRAFADSFGVAWTVREITPGPMPEKLSQLLGEDRRRGAWLLFMSERGEKRRLVPVPQGWAGLIDADLEACCMRARGAPPGPERRAEDHAPDA